MTVPTVDAAFAKFKSRLEITKTERENASRRQQTIRAQVSDALDVQHDFLTGSYARDTKTKPLKDVDIFVVLGDSERSRRDQAPATCLASLEEVLLEHYPRHRVERERRSVRVDFGVTVVDDTSDDVVSFDVVPAFPESGAYVIPDVIEGEWIATNPKVHADLATEANKQLGGAWKPAVKMFKKWNAHHDKPINPSFLGEVMALKLLMPPWVGPYSRELRQLFASAAERLDAEWPDPSGLGPPVSDRMDGDPVMMNRGKSALRAAEAACTRALKLEREGKVVAALGVWQELFGPLFAKT